MIINEPLLSSTPAVSGLYTAFYTLITMEYWENLLCITDPLCDEANCQVDSLNKGPVMRLFRELGCGEPEQSALKHLVGIVQCSSVHDHS